jgi:hypothetical protein
LLRPRDLALLLLASSDLLPRQRARDQQADRTGMELKRLLLDRLAALDPEPADLEATLVQIVEDIGPPTGPTRALAVVLKEDWELACADPVFLRHLLTEAAERK